MIKPFLSAFLALFKGFRVILQCLLFVRTCTDVFTGVCHDYEIIQNYKEDSLAPSTNFHNCFKGWKMIFLQTIILYLLLFSAELSVCKEMQFIISVL